MRPLLFKLELVTVVKSQGQGYAFGVGTAGERRINHALESPFGAVFRVYMGRDVLRQYGKRHVCELAKK